MHCEGALGGFCLDWVREQAECADNCSAGTADNCLLQCLTSSSMPPSEASAALKPSEAFGSSAREVPMRVAKRAAARSWSRDGSKQVWTALKPLAHARGRHYWRASMSDKESHNTVWRCGLCTGAPHLSSLSLAGQAALPLRPRRRWSAPTASACAWRVAASSAFLWCSSCSS